MNTEDHIKTNNRRQARRKYEKIYREKSKDRLRKYQRAWYAKKWASTTPRQREEILTKRRAWFRQWRRNKYPTLSADERIEKIEKLRRWHAEYRRINRDQILRRQREKYNSDAEMRKRIWDRQKLYLQRPEIKARRAQLLRDRIRKNPEKYRKKRQIYMAKTRAAYLERLAAWRKTNRHRIALVRRAHCQLITDRWVHERLSANYLKQFGHTHPNKWTPEQVEKKREEIIRRRARRITTSTAKEIRNFYGLDLTQTTFSIAKKYKISPLMVWGIIRNKNLIDKNYFPPPRTRGNSKTALKVLRMINSAALLADFAKEQKSA